MRSLYFAPFLLLTLLSHCAMGAMVDRSERSTSYEEGAADQGYPEEAKTAMREEKPAPGGSQDSGPGVMERMVIYQAKLRNSVNEIESAIQRSRAIAEKYGGYVEKQRVDKDETTAYLLLRIPVKSFHEALNDLGSIGKVLDRNISADDITKEFADLSQRLENRKRLLARLYEILKKTTDTKQKIRILNEIARLNKEVESMQARKDYMAKKAAFSTIEVSFAAEAKTSVNQGSAIPWIRGLRPSARTLAAAPEFDIVMPDGFLDYSEDYGDSGEYIYASPDGVKIRTATIPNNPRANAAYYEKALLYERDRYPEKVLSITRQNNRIALTTPQQVGYNTAYYTIVVFVEEDNLHVIEVFYPGPDVYEKQKSAVEASLKSIEPKSAVIRMLEALL